LAPARLIADATGRLLVYLAKRFQPPGLCIVEWEINYLQRIWTPCDETTV